MNKKFFLMLLMACISFALADEVSIWNELPKTKVSSEFVKDSVSLDSVKIYQDLIAQEDEKSHYGINIAGIVEGSIFVGVGTFFLAGGIYAINSNDDWLGFGNGLLDARGTMLVIAVPLYLVGIPFLVYHIGAYKTCKKHAAKRDEYRDALYLYKLRQQQNEHSSVQLMVIPRIDVANAGFGANAMLFF